MLYSSHVQWGIVGVYFPSETPISATSKSGHIKGNTSSEHVPVSLTPSPKTPTHYTSYSRNRGRRRGPSTNEVSVSRTPRRPGSFGVLQSSSIHTHLFHTLAECTKPTVRPSTLVPRPSTRGDLVLQQICRRSAATPRSWRIGIHS